MNENEKQRPHSGSLHASFYFNITAGSRSSFFSRSLRYFFILLKKVVSWQDFEFFRPHVIVELRRLYRLTNLTPKGNGPSVKKKIQENCSDYAVFTKYSDVAAEKSINAAF